MSILQRIQAPFLAPAAQISTNPMQRLRERVLAANIFVLIAFGSIGYTLFLISDILHGFSDPSFWAEIPVNTLGFGLFCAIAFLRRIPFGLRAGMLVGALALIALSDKLQAGLSGIGELLILVNMVLLSLFFGWRGSLVGFAIALTTMALPGWLITTGRIAGPAVTRESGSHDPFAWVLTSLAVLIFSLMLVVSVASVLDQFNAVIQQDEAKTPAES